MRVLKAVRLRLRSLFRRGRVERELDAELRDHLEREIERHVARGLSPDDARAAARREFGSVLRVAEDARAAWGWATLERWLQDVRYGARNLRSRPAFLVVAVTTLGLSIGANTAIFSVFNAALLRPLPYPDPDRLVALYSVNRSQEAAPALVAPADYRDWREQTRSLEELAAYTAADLLSVRLGDRLEPLTISRVTWNYFRAFGVQPMLGTGFEESDETASVPGLTDIVLSHRIWQSRFGGDRGIVGRRIPTASGSAVVAGVMPPDFRFPEYADIWTPIACCGELALRGTRYWRVSAACGTVTRSRVPGTSCRALPPDLPRPLPRRTRTGLSR